MKNSHYDEFMTNGARLIVAGSRNFGDNLPKDYEFAKERLDFLTKNIQVIEVISGGAKGADQLGERWATERGLPIRRCDADWESYGRSAGPRRNEGMASLATHLIAFWDGRSRGTKDMINRAKGKGLEIRIVSID